MDNQTNVDQPDMADILNPYNAFDNGPTLLDRYYLNMEAANRTGTVMGAMIDAGRPADRALFDARYEALPEWEGPLEGTAALFGQLAGTIWHNEASVPAVENALGIGAGARVVAWSGKSLSALSARIFAGATDAAIVNAVTDAAIQGIEKEAGYRDEYSASQWLASTALGTVAGGVMGPISHRPTPEARIAGQIETGSTEVVRSRQVDPYIEQHHISAPTDSPDMSLSLPDGQKLDFGDAAPLTEAKKALLDSQGSSEPVAFGDKILPAPKRPDAPDVQQMATDETPLWTNNGKWSATDPDIVEVGQFGPVIDIEAHGKDWGKVVARLQQIEAGEAPRALDHPEIGDIDAVWGSYDAAKDKGGGLKKIIEKHPEVLEDLPELIRGAEIHTQSPNRIRLVNGDRKAVIRLDYDGAAKTWLMTAFEKRKDRHIEGSTERLESHQVDTHSSSTLPVKDNVNPKGGDIKESRRSDGTMGRDRDHQGDTSSTSSADQDLRLDAPEGKPDAGASKADPELDAVIAKMESEELPFLSKARKPLRDALSRPDEGIARSEAQVKLELGRQRVSDLIEKLSDLADVVAVRQGILKRPGKSIKHVWGTFNTKTGVVRTKVIDDYDAFTHEVGHNIDQSFGKDLTNLMLRHRTEVEALHYDGLPEDLWLTEGFAEYFRLFLTNPNAAAREAPRFNSAFIKYLKKDHADFLQGVVELQDAWYDFLHAPSGEVYEADMVSIVPENWMSETVEKVRETGFGNTISDWLHDFYRLHFNRMQPIWDWRRELLRKYRDNHGGKLWDLWAINDPAKLARAAQNADQAAKMDIDWGIFPYRGDHPVTKSMADILTIACGKRSWLGRFDPVRIHKFNTYLRAKREAFEWVRHDAGEIANPPSKFSPGEAELVIAEYEKAFPEFIEASEELYKFLDAKKQKERDAGLISQRKYEELKKIKNYVPLQRDFSEAGDPAGKTGKSGQRPGQYKKTRGSTRKVINPIEIILQDVRHSARAIAINDVMKAMGKMLDEAGEGIGAFGERVPAHEMRRYGVNPKEVMKKALKQEGYSEKQTQEFTDLLDELISDDELSLYQPKVIQDHGKQIVTFREGGQDKAIRLPDGKMGEQLFDLLTGLTPHEKNIWWQNAFYSSAGLLRFGVTSVPSFLMVNAVRDLTSSIILYGQPFKRIKYAVGGVFDEMHQADIAKQYNRMGGIMGGVNAATLRDADRGLDANKLGGKSFLTKRFKRGSFQGALKGLAELSELTETGIRLGLAKSFADDAKALGLPDHAAMFDAVEQSMDFLDFGRYGSAIKPVNRLVPFMNASLQGLDKMTRVSMVPLIRKWKGDILTPTEMRDYHNAVNLWRFRILPMMLGSMALHAVNKQYENYEDYDDQIRARNWAVPVGNGEFRTVPKPHEFGTFANLAEALWDWRSDLDPTWAERYMTSLFSVTAPPNPFTGNPITKSYFEATSNIDAYSGRDIVPRSRQGMEPSQQYSAYTSEVAKMFGETFNVSPAMSEKMFVNFFGSMGRGALALTDLALGDKPELAPERTFAVGWALKTPEQRARSVTEFWELVSATGGTFEKAYQTYRDLGSSEQQDYLESLDDETRVYLSASSIGAKVKRLHPLGRVRDVLSAVNQLRMEIMENEIQASGGALPKMDRATRALARTNLQRLAMYEARNALVLMEHRGWEHREIADIVILHDQLKRISPEIYKALADRLATKNVVPFETVREIWPDYRKRLLEDGSDAPMADFEAIAKYERELDGDKIKRKAKPVVPGQGG